MMKTIDARGLACPAPVLLVKEAVDVGQATEMTVLVDNEPARENVARFLGSRSYKVTVDTDGSTFTLTASGTGAGEVAQPVQPAAEANDATHQKIVVLVATDRIGNGDDELGQKLMVSYIKTLKEMGPDLWQLIFLNGGVRLSLRSSPVLSELQAYERDGIIVLACGTCLEHFGLTRDKAVGETTNMLDIVTACQLADKVVSLG
ncbi:MAG: sulfurtransferase-like selenium metabolism protein YedF [Desulfopila sp.]